MTELDMDFINCIYCEEEVETDIKEIDVEIEEGGSLFSFKTEAYVCKKNPEEHTFFTLKQVTNGFGGSKECIKGGQIK